MNATLPPEMPRCPYCTAPVSMWRAGSQIEPCHECERPMVLLRRPFQTNAPMRLYGLLALATTAYGLAMIGLVAAFAFTDMSPRRFVSLLSILLFVIGSALIVDGILAARTRIDVTWHNHRIGKPALLMGLGKTFSGTFAIVLTLVAIGLG